MIVSALLCQGDGSTPRPVGHYFREFDALAGTGVPILLFLDRSLSLAASYPNVRVEPLSIEDLPLWQQCEGIEVVLPEYRNPAKDTRDYLIIVNSKPHLLARAAEMFPNAERLAWVDFGVSRLLKHPAETLKALEQLAYAARGLTMPGALPAPQPATEYPCWRHLGGFFVADHLAARAFAEAHAARVAKLLPQLTWEVNVWSWLEIEGVLGNNGIPLRWYVADHDDSMLRFTGSRVGRVPRLCVNMIVRNEAAIIERALASVAPHAECFVICDTGSTDDTRERIRRFCAARAIPLELHEFSFVNFSQARNEALARARQSTLAFDYLLLLDADMALVVEDADWLQGLSSDAALVRQQSTALAYSNIRLLRRDADARYEGATHEALVARGVIERRDGAYFVDYTDGASRSEKLVRDERLLREALVANPNDARAMYYLAQTFRDGGRHIEAAEWYEKRVTACGWEEERWHARYRAAQARLAAGDAAAFVAGLLEAYDMRPWRAEPLVCLARHWAAQSRHDAALHALEQARRIPYPAQDVLFVEPDAYGDSVEELVSISGFYSAIPQRKHDGMRAAEALAIRATCTPQVRETARRNLFFYSRPVGELCPGVAATRLEVALPEPYVAMNTSVAADGDGYIAIVRGVNYRLAGGRYDIADPARVVRTRNFVVRLRADLTIASLREIADRSSLPRHESAFIRGFEDCRLFRWQGRWHCSATARDVGADGRATMVLLAMDGACDIEAATVLSGFGDHLHQKNWMPAVGERLRFVYSCGPAVVVDASAPAGCVVVESMQDPGADLTHWRGGTQLVPWREGFLAVVHEAKDAPAGRQYLHRFVQFNEAAVPVAATPAFHFIAPGIEFASGLLAEQGAAGPQLLVTLGVGDCEAWAVRLPGEAVAAVLKPLEAK